jgi:hypothetical protein
MSGRKYLKFVKERQINNVLEACKFKRKETKRSYNRFLPLLAGIDRSGRSSSPPSPHPSITTPTIPPVFAGHRKKEKNGSAAAAGGFLAENPPPPTPPRPETEGGRDKGLT